MDSAPPLAELRAAARAALAAAGVEEAEAKTDWLLCELLACRRTEILPLHRDRRLSADEQARWAAWIRRLAAGEPLQYVLGWTEFLGRRFRTDARALIPRPETELLVQAVLDDAALWQDPAPRLADVGTGSGCIALSLALARPSAQVLALDLSANALALARENARALGVGARLRFVQADLLAGRPAGSLNAVVSNPPYVSTSVWAGLPRDIRDQEPALALRAGADGLGVLRRLIAQAATALRPHGRLFLEIGEEQAAAVRALMQAAEFATITVLRDWAGHERIVIGERT